MLAHLEKNDEGSVVPAWKCCKADRHFNDCFSGAQLKAKESKIPHCSLPRETL
jgi:hypothetical protein